MFFSSVEHNVKHPKAERLEDYCLTGVSEYFIKPKNNG